MYVLRSVTYTRVLPILCSSVCHCRNKMSLWKLALNGNWDVLLFFFFNTEKLIWNAAAFCRPSLSQTVFMPGPDLLLAPTVNCWSTEITWILFPRCVFTDSVSGACIFTGSHPVMRENQPHQMLMSMPSSFSSPHEASRKWFLNVVLHHA